MKFVNCILTQLSDGSLMLDPEITIDNLKWEEGDTFEVKIIHGVVVLVRVED